MFARGAYGEVPELVDGPEKPAAFKIRLLPQLEHCRAASIEVHRTPVRSWWFEATSPRHPMRGWSNWNDGGH